MKPRLKQSLLLILHAADGVPMPEPALFEAVRIHARPLQPTDGDTADALKELEAAGYAAGASDDIEGRTWTLTLKGRHKARQLR
jgi:hypothetical protein